MPTILVTGGAGYIGTHTVVQLLQAGHEVVVFDNLCNASAVALARVEQIAGKPVAFVCGDVRDTEALRAVFTEHAIEAVIHFAGLKAVGESVAQPLRYFDNNVQGSVALCQVMAEFDVKRLVFSSSATVYGVPGEVPYHEAMTLTPATNPYGRSKAMVEDVLRDLYQSDPDWSIALLRYFNPVGAHPSGLIGEDPLGIPNNLMPFIAQVAVGQRQCLSIFGNDYPTPDGTGVRDYIHVDDLARGHLAALQKFAGSGVFTYNLGAGEGTSVLEMVNAFEMASGKPIACEIVGRREGDLACFFADAELAKRELGWQTEKTIAQMCEDTWRWQSQNPRGYES